MAVLDTSVLIAGLTDPFPGELEISAISLAELHFGVLVARSATTRASRLRRLASIERAFEALPVDDAVARAYGTLAAAVVDAGRRPRSRSFDLVIAATARVHDARRYTLNAKNLAGLEDLVDFVAFDLRREGPRRACLPGCPERQPRLRSRGSALIDSPPA